MFVTECINSHTDQLNERDALVSVGEYHGYWPADSQSSVCLPQSSSSANRIEPALGKETRLDCCDSPVCFSWSPCLPAHKHSEPLPWCCWQYKSHALEAHQGWFTGLLTFFYCRTCHSEKSVNQAHCPNESTHTHWRRSTLWISASPQNVLTCVKSLSLGFYSFFCISSVFDGVVGCRIAHPGFLFLYIKQNICNAGKHRSCVSVSFSDWLMCL